MLTTEIDFTLPCGYLGPDGTLHKNGTMRLATAADEILPAKDPRVIRNPAYLVVIVLSRVVTRLGDVSEVNPAIIEALYAKDLAYLQELYNAFNGFVPKTDTVTCPECQASFARELPILGGSEATP